MRFDISLAEQITAATGFVATLDLDTGSLPYPVIRGEFWTSRQRQGNAIHDISYRACFKAQLPELFISLLSNPGAVVFDPFSGRGTTAIQTALMDRIPIANDINPLSRMLTEPRLEVPELSSISARLNEYRFDRDLTSDVDLSMFYHQDTLTALLNLRHELSTRREEGREDAADRWIRMVATNRLSGHSSGFFSVYTLPPNQAARPERQVIINQKREQKPPARNVAALILKKSKQLQKGLSPELRSRLQHQAQAARYLQENAEELPSLSANSVDLTVTSPPFLNAVQYADDNWLRLWFNKIPKESLSKEIMVTSSLDRWQAFADRSLQQLFRITRAGGYVAFEVGEVSKGSVRLEEQVIKAATRAGFSILCLCINQQLFTKTANIWGVNNNNSGTNTNRIVVMQKPN